MFYNLVLRSMNCKWADIKEGKRRNGQKKQDPIGRIWFGRRRGRKNDV
jgi:hypothetical protein